jgi:hypothetical protein
MVHFQDAGLASRTVMRSIRFPCLALLAVSQLPIRLDREIRRIRRCLRWQGTVAIICRRRRSGTCEDRSSVRPV